MAMRIGVTHQMTSEDSHDFKRSDKRPTQKRGFSKDRPYGNRAGGRDRKDFGDRKGPRNDRSGFRKGGERGHGPRSNERNGEKRPYRPHSDRPHDERTQRPERPKVVISTDPQRLLFKGTDFMEKGEDAKALLLFLHGSVLMSKGCENNALKIIDKNDVDTLNGIVAKISDDCSPQALIEYDYLCQIGKRENRNTYLSKGFEDKDTHAIYRMICLDRVEAEDDVIDAFAKGSDVQKISDGLKMLAKKKDSNKAEGYLKSLDEKKERKQYVHTAFVRAMKGDSRSKKDLERLSKEFPEAAFFLGYVNARDEDNAIPWLKEKFPQFQDLIISEEFNLRIEDTSYGMYLRAMKIKSKKEDWIPSMIKAAKYGSEEAMEELKPLMRRTDIKKAVANIHLGNNDLPGLVDDYVNGLDETYYLDKYCENIPEKIVEVGRKIGKVNPEREIDWLRAHAFMVECRDALVVRADDPQYHSRKLIYALHDVGRNMEAADLYFSMEGHPDLPAVKWLAKVCRDEDAKEYVRSHFESKGDLETFEYIFVDDGYKKRPKFKGRR